MDELKVKARLMQDDGGETTVNIFGFELFRRVFNSATLDLEQMKQICGHTGAETYKRTARQSTNCSFIAKANDQRKE